MQKVKPHCRPLAFFLLSLAMSSGIYEPQRVIALSCTDASGASVANARSQPHARLMARDASLLQLLHPVNADEADSLIPHAFPPPAPDIPEPPDPEPEPYRNLSGSQLPPAIQPRPQQPPLPPPPMGQPAPRLQPPPPSAASLPLSQRPHLHPARPDTFEPHPFPPTLQATPEALSEKKTESE